MSENSSLQLSVSPHPEDFSGQNHCANGGIIVLVSHAILQDQLVKRLCNYMEITPS